MEQVYLICAAIGGTLIVCQFLLTILGLGAHHDIGGHDSGDSSDFGGHDAGGHDASGHDSADSHDTSSHSEPNWFLSMLTFRTLTAAFAFFGLTGLTTIRLDLDENVGLVMAFAAAAGAFFGVAYLMRFMSRLNVDGTVRIGRAIGSHGTVYLSVPGAKAGVGKVLVNVLNRTVEYKAVTSQQQLPTGAKIVVVSIVSADTVEIAPAPDSERTTHV
jgi:hypothetical protein